MPETCRVSWQNKILDTWCILLDIYTKIITMHSHLNIKYSNILKPSHSSYLSAYEDGTECSETSAYKIQTPGNCPEESKQQTSDVPYGQLPCTERNVSNVAVSQLLTQNWNGTPIWGAVKCDTGDRQRHSQPSEHTCWWQRATQPALRTHILIQNACLVTNTRNDSKRHKMASKTTKEIKFLIKHQ
jgi:hypothetical protein